MCAGALHFGFQRQFKVPMRLPPLRYNCGARHRGQHGFLRFHCGCYGHSRTGSGFWDFSSHPLFLRGIFSGEVPAGRSVLAATFFAVFGLVIALMKARSILILWAGWEISEKGLFFLFVSVWNLASPPFACCICCCFDFGIAHQQKANGYEYSLGSTCVPITTVSETSFLGFLHELTLGFPACSRRANPGHLINTQQFWVWPCLALNFPLVFLRFYNFYCTPCRPRARTCLMSWATAQTTYALWVSG